jgi:hypothetical protein
VSDSGDELRLNWIQWWSGRFFPTMLGGWKPLGTTAPEGWLSSTEWDGDYGHAKGQRVRADDALMLASVLDDMGNHMPQIVEMLKEKAGEQLLLPPGTDLDTAQGQMAGFFVRLASFCRSGSFTICPADAEPSAAADGGGR